MLWGIVMNSLNYTPKKTCVWLFGAILFGYLTLINYYLYEVNNGLF